MQILARVPAVDPLPLPGPVWLFQFLLLLTFTLHLVAMNCSLAGGVTALISAVRGRSERHPFSRRLATELGRMLPVFLAFTITLGVAALLFVQVLYGNLLYTSSILIGAFWLSVIALVIVAYYGFYFFDSRLGKSLKSGDVPHFSEPAASPAAVAAAAISVACLLSVAFIFSNNMSLAWNPERWLAMYRAHPDGFNLNLAEPSLLPRYLHMLIGSFAVFAAVVCHVGCHRLKAAAKASHAGKVDRREGEYAGWLVRRFSQLFAAATGVQILVGLWFLLALPRPVAMQLLTNGGTALAFGVAVLCAMAALFLILVGGHSSRPAPFIHSGFGLTVITVALMVILRQGVRTAFVHAYAAPERLSTAPQTGLIVLFFVCFLLGLATVGYMLRLLARAKKAGAVSIPPARA